LFYFKIRRIFDVVAACVLLMFFTPLLITLAFCIFLTMGSPVIFCQKRAGLQGRIFTIYKLRTMNNGVDDKGQLLPDHKRLTFLGYWIRKLSLDELPQLLNIVKGEMSFIGPRPLLVEYLPLYSEEQKRRHEVLPGITGWAQINGRNALSWQQKFTLDVYYVDNISFFLDCKIFFRTFVVIFLAKNVNETSTQTSERFTGNELL